MTCDIFLSYKREDEKLATRLAKALEAEGYSVWWDRSLLPSTSWRDQIQTALDNASVTVVIWTKESAGPHGDFVRDEASQAKANGRLVPVVMEKTRLPLGFGELQAIDLVGWKGDRSSAFFKDLVAAIHAKLEGTEPPNPIGPLRRTLRRTSAGIFSTALLGTILAFTTNLLSIQDKACSVPVGQPMLSDVCGQFGLGGKPRKEERIAWASLPVGSCDALRAHVEHFPDGAYRSAAADRIAARRVAQEEVWEPAERRLRLAVISDGLMHKDEDIARLAADQRAAADAEVLCAGFAATQSYRVRSAEPVIESFDCETYARGVACSGRGEAVCTVEVRRILETETCGDPT